MASSRDSFYRYRETNPKISPNFHFYRASDESNMNNKNHACGSLWRTQFSPFAERTAIFHVEHKTVKANKENEENRAWAPTPSQSIGESSSSSSISSIPKTYAAAVSQAHGKGEKGNGRGGVPTKGQNVKGGRREQP